MSKALIIAIDDDATILKLVKAVLGKLYEIKTFSAPDKALESLKTGLSPDLIICDISMPEMSGFEVHEAVRDISSVRSTPFVYLTALDSRENIRQGMRQGADDYLTKPFTPDELRSAIAMRLERAQALKDEEDDDVLEISSLGGLGISAGGIRITWEAKKAVELLLYLLDIKKAVSLKQLHADLWWEDVSENNLHVLINRLRKAVDGVATLIVQDEHLSLELAMPYQWDAEQFITDAESALEKKESAALETAIQQYKGEFLPSFDSPWTERQRGRYDGLYSDVLELSIEAAPTETARQRAQARFNSYMDIGDDEDDAL